MQKHPFKTLGPDWKHLPHVHAFTILAEDIHGERIDFKDQAVFNTSSRQKLEAFVGDVHWLNQVHEATILELPDTEENKADGVFTSKTEVACVVRTADCLPLVFCDGKGTKVGVVHAGWRSIYADIIPEMLKEYRTKLTSLRVWIGPGIGQQNYEVGADFQARFVNKNKLFAPAFQVGKADKYYANLPLIAKLQLLEEGVILENISGGGWDTFSDPLMHSARRDGVNSGRMVTVAWMEKDKRFLR